MAINSLSLSLSLQEPWLLRQFCNKQAFICYAWPRITAASSKGAGIRGRVHGIILQIHEQTNYTCSVLSDDWPSGRRVARFDGFRASPPERPMDLVLSHGFFIDGVSTFLPPCETPISHSRVSIFTPDKPLTCQARWTV
ncbi:hypothetical protein CEXT_270141 [Caerostris extrusa]|uniref:Uncharacterized protein n=1 Tax=Caerostris extrusa TaxID=172846 RepID=A0AAV4X243_CAEEX|nr:hypothetical protein CEXT_270141 [Caerostris extrusa]